MLAWGLVRNYDNDNDNDDDNEARRTALHVKDGKDGCNFQRFPLNVSGVTALRYQGLEVVVLEAGPIIGKSAPQRFVQQFNHCILVRLHQERTISAQSRLLY